MRRPLSYDYLEAALSRAKRALSSEDYSIIHLAARAYAGGKARQRKPTTIPEGADPIPATADEADILFVAGSPTDLDVARGQPLTGEEGIAFRDVYLPEIPKDAKIAIVHAIPVKSSDSERDLETWAGWLEAEIRRINPARVVALGAVGEAGVIKAIGEAPDETVPHPGAYRIKPVRKSQIVRKLARIKRPFEKRGLDTAPEERRQPDHQAGHKPDIAKQVRIAKADRPRQIVYAVVLDPYQVDAHDDWVPVQHVESFAHEWLAKSRVVGLEHQSQANAYPVESWVVHYPSEDDYRKAVAGEAHRAYKMPFGSDVVHSGAWILGTKLGDAEWAQYEKGELDAYSIAGFGFRTEVTTKAMPEVEFIELGEAR